jgi:hypothetical protein
MAVVVDHSIIEASSFNNIRTFQDQAKSLDPTLLRSIGYIFIKNGVQDRLAVEIIHRHLALDEDTLLLHEQSEPNIKVCKVTHRSSLEESQLTGSCCCLFC